MINGLTQIVALITLCLTTLTPMGASAGEQSASFP